LLLLTPTPDLLRHAPARAGWRRLRSLLAPFRSAALGAVLVSVLLAGVRVAFPVVTQLLVDRVLPSGGGGLPVSLIAGLALAGACLGAALPLRQRLLERLLDGLSCNLTADRFDRLLGMPWRYFLSRPVGALFARLEGGRDAQRALTRLTLTTLLDMLLLPVGLGLILSYSVPLGLITLAPLALSAGVAFLVAARGQPHVHRSTLREASARSSWVEAIQSIATLKDATAEPDVSRRHRALLSDPALEDPEGRRLLQVGGAWAAAAHLVAGACALWYGAHLLLRGQLTVGQLVALQGLVGLLAVPALGLAGL